MCLTDLNHYKHSKMTIFWVRLTQERIGTVFSGVRPIAVTRDLCVRILKFTDKIIQNPVFQCYFINICSFCTLW